MLLLKTREYPFETLSADELVRAFQEFCNCNPFRFVVLHEDNTDFVSFMYIQTTSLVESAPLFANWDENLASYFVHYLPVRRICIPRLFVFLSHIIGHTRWYVSDDPKKKFSRSTLIATFKLLVNL